MPAVNPTYLFYDLETSGLNPCFDQVMQFAAIRTDLQLNEIERYEWLVKLKPENIANPYAIITHGLLPKDCENGKTDYKSTKDIHLLLNTPGTISGGYNTLGFDDTFLRFSFYKNLLPPYTHQYANQCGRFDIYPLAILFYLYSDIEINWPFNNEKQSMKLEDLNQANQLAKGNAHEAMCDVEATLALTKIFQQDHERFKYAMGFFDKKTDALRTDQITTKFCIALEGKLGAKNNFQSLAVPLGQHLSYTNQSLWLSLDRVDFATIDPKEIIQHTYVLKKRAGEAPFILPALDRFLEKCSTNKLNLAEKNCQWLMDHPQLAEQIKQHHQSHKYPIIENADCFAQLYQINFPDDHDQYHMQLFHQTDQKNQHTILNLFHNPIYKELGERLLGTNSSAYQQARLGINQESIIDYQNKDALILPKAQQLCRDILANDQHIQPKQKTLCEAYKNYLDQLALSTTENIA